MAEPGRGSKAAGLASSLALLAAVYGAHYIYYQWPPGRDRAWVMYVGTHVLVIVALMFLLPQARRQRGAWAAWLGAMACWWGGIESAQAAVCSIWHWGRLAEADLCVEVFGQWPYALLAAGLGASLLMRRNMNKRGAG